MFFTPYTTAHQILFAKECHDDAWKSLADTAYAGSAQQQQQLAIMEQRLPSAKLVYKVMSNLLLSTPEQKAANPRFRDQLHFLLIWAEWALWYPRGDRDVAAPTLAVLLTEFLVSLRGLAGYDRTWINQAMRMPDEKNMGLFTQLMKLCEQEHRLGLMHLPRRQQWKLVELGNLKREVQKHFGVPSEFKMTLDFIEQLANSPLLAGLMALHEVLVLSSAEVQIPAVALTGFFGALGAILEHAIQHGPLATEHLVVGRTHRVSQTYEKALKELWGLENQYGTMERPIMPEAWNESGQQRSKNEWVDLKMGVGSQ